MQKNKKFWGLILLSIYLSFCFSILFIYGLISSINGKTDTTTWDGFWFPLLFLCLNVLATMSVFLKMKYNNSKSGWAIFSLWFIPLALIFEYFFWKSLKEKEENVYYLNFSWLNTISLTSLILAILHSLSCLIFGFFILSKTNFLFWLGWIYFGLSLLGFFGTGLQIYFSISLIKNKFHFSKILLLLSLTNLNNLLFVMILLDKKIEIKNQSKLLVST